MRKHFYILIFFFLIFNENFGQTFSVEDGDTINRIDVNNKKQGYWKVYKEIDGEKKLLEEGNYIDNKKIGKWTEYYFNGKKKNSLTFANGKPDGEAYMFHEDGSLSEKGTWKGGRWHGEYFLFYKSTGTIEHKFFFNENGKREGIAKYYYINGKIAIEAEFKDGKEHGEITQYNIFGKIIGKFYYVDGKMNEESTLRFNKINKDYLDFQSDSLTKAYNDRKLEASGNNLSLFGKNITYNKNKQITKEGVFYNNRLYDGKAYIYDENGILLRTSIYKDGNYIEDEYNKNATEEDKAKKDLLDKLKLKDENLFYSLNSIINETKNDLKQKEELLNEQILKSQMLVQDKKIRELLLKQKESEINQQQIANQNKEFEIATLNKNKRIKEIELKNQVAENQKKEQEIKIIEQAGKLQTIEVEQQKKIRNIFIGGISILLIGFIYIIKSYLEKKKSNLQLAQQNSIIQNQKILVEEKQREVYESISYAKRLQVAILPPLNLIKNHLPDSFVLYKPKDIVAGDFYWFETKNDILLIAAADCTGHGVPGAMVSVVCSNALNRTVNEFKLTKPGEILDKVRELVMETFSKSETEVKDGMDISLCSINKATNEICWSGANNPLWYIQNSVSSSGVENKELIEIKADKQPIGKYALEKPFTTHSIKLNKKDSLYLFTDGYADQFGGPKGKKFKYKQLQELLISIQHEEPNNQEIILNQKFEEWKKNTEQVDDVCIIGITF